MWSLLSTKRRLQLRKALIDIQSAQETNVITMGSLLSGTNVQNDMVDGLVVMWKEELGAEFEPQYLFSCEDVEWKQEFLRSRTGAGTIYPCVHALAACPSATLDIDGRVCALTRCGFLFFCIECDSISGLNHAWAEALDCVEKAFGVGEDSRTGMSAVSCIRLLTVAQPWAWMAECVKNLLTRDPDSGKSCYEIIKLNANKLGYAVNYMCVDASDVGDPESRDRPFLLGHWVGIEKALNRPKRIQYNIKRHIAGGNRLYANCFTKYALYLRLLKKIFCF